MNRSVTFQVLARRAEFEAYRYGETPRAAYYTEHVKAYYRWMLLPEHVKAYYRCMLLLASQKQQFQR